MGTMLEVEWEDMMNYDGYDRNYLEAYLGGD